MDIKKNYYNLESSEFNKYLENIKSNPSTISFFNNKFYYLKDDLIYKKLLDLYRLDILITVEIGNYNKFIKNQIIQKILIDEIESTNEIENIYSAKHDIYCILNNKKINKSNKIKSISNTYKLLLNSHEFNINSLDNIRQEYDKLLNDCVEKSDLPDGKLFRKDCVVISNGITYENIKFNDEIKINAGLNEMINLYKNDILDKYEIAIITHFMFETIHPFYDGNGRLGRYLFSKYLNNKNSEIPSLLISYSIALNKNKYYNALETRNDYHEFGFINKYVEIMLDILINGFDKFYNELINKKSQLNECKIKLTNTQKIIYNLLDKASIYTYFGISNDEILENIKVSKRTLIDCISYFRDNFLLEETKIGNTTYHKIKKVL